jgi:hypothetical protein
VARLRAVASALRTPVRVIRAADIDVLILSEGTLPHAPSERATTLPPDDDSVKTKQHQILGRCADGSRGPTLGTPRRPADLFRLTPRTCGSHMSILVRNCLRAQFGANPRSDPPRRPPPRTTAEPPPPARPQNLALRTERPQALRRGAPLRSNARSFDSRMSCAKEHSGSIVTSRRTRFHTESATIAVAEDLSLTVNAPYILQMCIVSVFEFVPLNLNRLGQASPLSRHHICKSLPDR